MRHAFKLRRGFVLGFVRAKRQARKQMHAMAADFDAELVALQHEFHVSVHRERYRALDEAIIQRATDLDMVLN